MPSYRVIAPGFFGGTIYEPGGKREIIDVDKPFKVVPSWMVLIDEKEEAKTARKQREAKQVNDAKSAKAADKVETDGTDFLGKNSKVETL